MSALLTSRDATPRCTASAAAAPIAWPIAMQVHWARMPANAIRLAETFRPPTVIRRLPFGTRARNGTFGNRRAWGARNPW